MFLLLEFDDSNSCKTIFLKDEMYMFGFPGKKWFITIFLTCPIFLLAHSGKGHSHDPKQWLSDYEKIEKSFISLNKNTKLNCNGEISEKRRCVMNLVGRVGDLFELRANALSLFTSEGNKLAERILEQIRDIQRLNAINSMSSLTNDFELYRTEIDEDGGKKLIKLLNTLKTCYLTTCNEIERAKEFQNFFFEVFNKYKNKGEINSSDTSFLVKVQMLWSSFYVSGNNYSESQKNGGIPFYNVNGHNDSFWFWIKEYRFGNYSEPIPLIHIDTHTDMAGVKNNIQNYSGDENHFAHHINTLDIASLLSSSGSDLNEKIYDLIGNIKYMPEETKELIIDRIANSSLTPDNAIKDALVYSSKKRVQSIAQPVTAAASFKLSDHIIMCLPPWSPRLRRNLKTDGYSKGLPFQYEALLGFNGPNMYIGTSDSRVRSARGNPLKSSRSLGRKQKDFPIGFSVMQCNEEKHDPSTDEIVKRTSSEMANFPRFVEMLSVRPNKKKYILDIDLDGFASEGRGRIATPVSYLRGKKTSVSKREFKAVIERVDFLFQQLEEAKQEGFYPQVITISDSTKIRPGIATSYSLRQDGGLFTPRPLVFMLNYYVRMKLKETFGNLVTFNESFNFDAHNDY